MESETADSLLFVIGHAFPVTFCLHSVQDDVYLTFQCKRAIMLLLTWFNYLLVSLGRCYY